MRVPSAIAKVRAARASMLSVAVMAVGVASASCTSSSINTSPAPETGKIVFSVDAANASDPGVTEETRRESSRIAVMNIDGTGLSVIPAESTATNDADPVWSPNGQRIAFDRTDAAGTHVYTMDADGLNVRSIMPSVEASEPRWSPEGDRLSFVGRDGALFVASVGGDVRRLASDAVDSAEWSPDARSLLYASNSGDGDYALKVLDVAGGRSRTISNDLVSGPSWSPDGESVCFVGSDEQDGDVLRVVDRDGDHLRTLTRDVVSPIMSDAAPQWSPDGERILYATGNEPSQIAVVKVRDRTVSHLSTGQSSSYAPIWAADGAQIAFVRERSPWGGLGTDVWLMDADGTAKRELTDAFQLDGGSDGPPRWSSGLSSATPMAALPNVRRALIDPTRLIHLFTPAPLTVAAAVGSTVAFTEGDGGVHVWYSLRHRVWSFADTCGDCLGVKEVALAGSRVAWLRMGEQHGSTWTDIYLGALGHRQPSHIDHMYETTGRVGNVHASGSLIVYNSWTRRRTGQADAVTLWRISGKTKHAIGRGAYTGPPGTAVDGERIALVQRNGGVALLNADGRRLDRFSIRTRSVRGALLRGTQLFVLGHTSVDIYDIGRHRKLRTLPLQLGISGYARLVGEQKRLLVYVSGIAIHVVRLFDGRDLTLYIRRQSGPAVAALTTRGLFVGYEPSYGAKPDGILEFIPFARLRGAFKRTG